MYCRTTKEGGTTIIENHDIRTDIQEMAQPTTTERTPTAQAEHEVQCGVQL